MALEFDRRQVSVIVTGASSATFAAKAAKLRRATKQLVAGVLGPILV
jgi:hypothetical protein